MTTLKTVSDHQDLILLAEIGALIHDLGKLSGEFVEHYSKGVVSKSWPKDVHHEVLKSHGQCNVPSALQTILDDSDRPRAIASAVQQGLLTKGWSQKLAQETAEECRKRIRASRFSDIKAQLSPRGRPYSGLSDAQSDELAGVIASTVDPAIWHENRLDNEKLISDDFVLAEARKRLTETVVEYGSESVLLKDFVEMHHGEHWQLPQLVRLLKADLGGVDGFDSWIDKGKLPRKGAEQTFGKSLIATAFGHEAQRLPVGPNQDGLKPVRDQFAKALADVLSQMRDGQATPAQVRERILGEAENAFRQALGETRRAANDVTLWDHSYSVASLYKAALAKVLLEGKWTEPKDIGWRFLRIGVDGLQFFAQAHHVTDVLGRRQALMEALNQVQEVLEVDCPVGNEVYRDENGSIIVMPDLADENTYQELASDVDELVLEAFQRTGLGGELVPKMVWNDEGPVREDMITSFGCLVTQPLPSPTPETRTMREWWENTLAKEKEVCTVCVMRPVGYVVPELDEWVTSRKASDRNVCGVCLQRRGRRARAWARNERTPDEILGPFARTIWTDEVADNNGRLALVVGRFVLDDWLSGKLVATMLVAPGISKNPSPARIRRIWETTRRFWLEVQDDLIPTEVGERHRWAIRPANAHRLNDPRPDQGLGKWHTYEAELAGHRLSLCWDPNDEEAQGRDLFWTTDNLDYFVKLAGMERGNLKKQIQGARLRLYESGGYPGQDRRLEVDAERCQVEREVAYRPYIPLLAEPAIFMALVPADKALEVVQATKAKYDQEMARVRDRLPLHLGLVFAHRRTPLAAILEAGRAMLKMPGAWEEWQVSVKDRKATFSRDGHVFKWDYPAKMGDNETEDIWYPHLLVVDPGPKAERSLQAGDFCLVDDLVGTSFIRPSRIDFEFLDTTARRFEIAYDDQGRRRSPNKRNRPYLLDDLERLGGLWKELCYLEKSQRHQVIATIEATREAWFGDDWKGQSLTDQVFRQFVHDTLAGAAWPKGHRWKTIPDQRRKELVAAGVRGELADLAELHLQILKE